MMADDAQAPTPAHRVRSEAVARVEQASVRLIGRAELAGAADETLDVAGAQASEGPCAGAEPTAARVAANGDSSVAVDRTRSSSY